jgi:sigma-B regulation protein RsbU (phosphoserine phosphatase)
VSVPFGQDPPAGPAAGDQPTNEQALAALQVLLRSSHSTGPDDLPALVTASGRELGAATSVLYLVDYDQVLLVPLAAPAGHAVSPDAAAEGAASEAVDGPLVVDTTLAGRAYTDVKQLWSAAGPALTVWTPVLDGTQRLGVLRQDCPHGDGPRRDEPSPSLLAASRDVASLLAQMVLSRSLCGDAVERARRLTPMSLPAELAWRALPPLTFVSPVVAIAGVLAPSTEVGGDSFDYALNGSTMHVAIFDAMGHGLQASLLATVAIGALRNARRGGVGLAATVGAIDQALATHFPPGTFVTGIVGELDVTGGWWRWATCGHAPVLLVRNGRVVKQLDAVTDVPLGLGLLSEPEIGVERLQPGDRLLMHTDGVSEARNAEGEFFGTDRLVEFTSRQAADGRPAAETLRRLKHAILEYQEGSLQDDATTVMVEWLGDPGELHSPLLTDPGPAELRTR